MERLVSGLATCLAGLALLLAVAGCGSGTAGQSVSVKQGPTLQASGREVYVFILMPGGNPSGVIALKSVHDGHVRTLSHMEFTHMTGQGAAAVEITRGAIVPFWNVPSNESASAQSEVRLPPGSVTSGTAWGSLTALPAKLDAEQVFWTQDRYIDKAPDEDGTYCGGSFAAVVRASLETPRKTSYCLTISVRST